MKTSSLPDIIQESAHLEKLRTQITTDIESMNQQEANLRDYEQRLRQLVEHTRPSQPAQGKTQQYIASGPSQIELDSEWEKYERAHALLEAARRSLCEDRLILKDREKAVAFREEEAARREAWVKVREQELAALPPVVIKKSKPSFTSAQFQAAKNIFSLGKSS